MIQHFIDISVINLPVEVELVSLDGSVIISAFVNAKHSKAFVNTPFEEVNTGTKETGDNIKFPKFMHLYIVCCLSKMGSNCERSFTFIRAVSYVAQSSHLIQTNLIRSI